MKLSDLINTLIAYQAKTHTNPEVQVAVGSTISPIIDIRSCVDMDTNITNLVIYGNDRNYYKEIKEQTK